MSSFRFEVEFVEPQGRYALARSLSPARFELGPGSRLGGVEVMAITRPPATSPDGSRRDDIFLFRLKDPSSAKRLRVGQTVELRAELASP